MNTNRTQRFSTFPGQVRPTSALPPTGGKRGVTPSKTEANEQQSRPKPKFTAQQQLDILERLEKGDFVRGVGLQQFYEEPRSTVAGPSTRKNLLSEFDKLQISEPSMGAPTLSSTKLSEATDKDDATGDMNPCINLMEYGIHEQNPDAYECMDFMDKIIVQHQIKIQDMMTLCRIRSEAAFAQIAPPQQLINLFYRMDEVTRTVRKFMKKPEMERARLFLPPSTFSGQREKEDGKNQEPKRSIQVDVLDQQNFLKTFEKLPGMMEWIQGVLKTYADDKYPSDERTAKLKNIIAKMLAMVDALEEGLTRMETNDAENLELCNKVWDCEEDDATNTTTSSEYSPISDTTP